MGGRLVAGARASSNQVTVDADADVLWLDVTELPEANADALIAVLSHPNTGTIEELPAKLSHPLVGLLTGVASEEQALALTRFGYLGDLLLAELTPTRLNRVDLMDRLGTQDAGAEVVSVALRVAESLRWAELTPQSELPTIALIENDTDDEAELLLTRSGFRHCAPSEDLCASTLLRAFRRATARTQSTLTVKQTAPAEMATTNDFGCPACDAPTEADLDLCADCGASFSTGVAQTIRPAMSHENGSSMSGQTDAGYTFPDLI